MSIKVMMNLIHPILKIHEVAAIAMHNNVRNIHLRLLCSPFLYAFIIASIVPPTITKTAIIIIPINKYNNKALLTLDNI